MRKFSGEKRQKKEILNSQINSPVAEIFGSTSRGASFIGSGKWALRKEHNQFQERVEQFYQMTQRQRNQFIEKFNSLPVQGATLPMKGLSVTPQNCMSLYPPFSIIEQIFAKAAEILNSSPVMPAKKTKSWIIHHKK